MWYYDVYDCYGNWVGCFDDERVADLTAMEYWGSYTPRFEEGWSE